MSRFGINEDAPIDQTGFKEFLEDNSIFPLQEKVGIGIRPLTNAKLVVNGTVQCSAASATDHAVTKGQADSTYFRQDGTSGNLDIANQSLLNANTVQTNTIQANGNLAINNANLVNVNSVFTDNINTSGTFNIDPFLSYENDLLTVSKQVFFNDDVTIQGALVTADSLQIDDTIIVVANGNPGDVVDVGIAANYAAGYTGLIRDATDKKWKLFDTLTVPPTTVIDTSNMNFADLQLGNITSEGNIDINNNKIINLPQPTASGEAARYDETTLIESNVSILQSNITTLESNIVSLESDISTLNGNISTLEGNITSIENDISTLNSNISILEGNISTLEGNITSIESDISTLNGNISTLEGNITSIESDISTLNGNITTIESDISTLDGNITTLEGNITSIETNYIKKDGSVVFTGNLNLNTNHINNVVDPVEDQDVATKKYVDDNVGGGSPPMILLQKTAQQTIANSSYVSIIWDSTTLKEVGDWSYSSPYTTLTIPETGVYLFTYSLYWRFTAPLLRQHIITSATGTKRLGSIQTEGTIDYRIINSSFIGEFTAGDTFYLQVFHNYGADNFIISNTSDNPDRFSIVKIG